MKIFLNGRLDFAQVMAFDNGWSILIAMLPCGHCSYTAIPTYVGEMIDNRTLTEEIAKDYTREAMEARGDYVDHFKKDDGELLDIIVGVASRATEPHLEKTRHDILKAARA